LIGLNSLYLATPLFAGVAVVLTFAMCPAMGRRVAPFKRP